MFDLFGIDELNGKVNDLYEKYNDLNRYVRVWGNEWCLAQHIFANPGGIWNRLSALEQRVYGHDGQTEPQEAEPVYRRLSNLETTVNGANGHFGLSQHILGTGKPGQEGLWKKLEQLEEENRKLREQVQKLQNMEKLLIEAVNKQLGTID